MAYERLSDSKIKGEGLDAFVESSLKNFQRQLSIRNAADETNFATAVLEQNLSLDDQLNYRKEQLKRVSDDPDERKRIRSEISGLIDRIEAKKFSDDYTSKLIEFENGASSLDSVISWLTDRKSNTTDMAIQSEIDKQLVTQTTARFDLQNTVLKAQTDWATKDKSPEIIDAQISRVTSAKNQAMLSGNTAQATIYGLQLSALTRAKTENSIDAASKNFAVATMSGYLGASAMLDEYNKKISGAGTTGAFTIGGVTYNSEKEFWQFKRDSYIADDSANGLFSRLSNEQSTQLKVRSSQNLLSNDDLTKATAAFTALSSRPELQSYAQKIDSYKQDVLQTGIDLRSTTIQNQYAIDFDVNKAVSSLNGLKALGGNVDAATTKILTDAANIKTSQVSNILQVSQDLLKNNPGMTPEQALDQAIKSGAAATYSPGQLATKSEADIAKETAAAAAGGNFQTDPRTTVTPDNASATPAVSGLNTPPSVDPVKQGEVLSQSGRYYIDSTNGMDQYDSQTGQKLTPEQSKALNLNAALLPKKPGPSTPTPSAPVTTPAPVPAAPVQTVTLPKATAYTGTSVVDYLKSTGQDTSYTSRAKLATQKGITGYTGTAEQNLKLLNALRGS